MTQFREPSFVIGRWRSSVLTRWSSSGRNVPRKRGALYTLCCFNCLQHYLLHQSSCHKGEVSLDMQKQVFPSRLGFTKEDFWRHVGPSVSPLWSVLIFFKEMWCRDLSRLLFCVVFKAMSVRLLVLNFASLEKWLRLGSLSEHSAYGCVSLDTLDGWHLHERSVCSFSRSSNWLHFLLAVVQLKLHCPVHCFIISAAK